MQQNTVDCQLSPTERRKAALVELASAWRRLVFLMTAIPGHKREAHKALMRISKARQILGEVE